MKPEAQRDCLHRSTVNEPLRLTLPGPAITQSIPAGQQPMCMSLLWFQRKPLPADRVAQRAAAAGSLPSGKAFPEPAGVR